MRFWLLSSHEGPDDPEGIKIFKVAPGEEDGPQKKIATAVYEYVVQSFFSLLALSSKATAQVFIYKETDDRVEMTRPNGAAVHKHRLIHFRHVWN